MLCAYQWFPVRRRKHIPTPIPISLSLSPNPISTTSSIFTVVVYTVLLMHLVPTLFVRHVPVVRTVGSGQIDAIGFHLSICLCKRRLLNLVPLQSTDIMSRHYHSPLHFLLRVRVRNPARAARKMPPLDLLCTKILSSCLAVLGQDLTIKPWKEDRPCLEYRIYAVRTAHFSAVP